MDWQDLFDTVDPKKFRTASAETRALISAKNKGRKHTPETCDKIRAANKGVPKSKEAVAKRSAKLKGRPVTSEVYAKMLITNEKQRNVSKPFSEEHLANLRLKKCKPMMTPHGLFPSKAAVIKAAGVAPATVNKWLKKFPNDYYYITTPAK